MRWTAYEESVSRKEEEMGPVIKGKWSRDPKKKGGKMVCPFVVIETPLGQTKQVIIKLEKDIITSIIERENARFEKSSS